MPVLYFETGAVLRKSNGSVVASRGLFDVEGFFSALDSQRISRQLTWRQVASEAGVSASTLTRMSQGNRPDVDGLAALCRWSGLRADDYLTPGEGSAEPLTKVSTWLRGDRNLTPEAAEALDQVIKATYERLTTNRPR
jgi:transcriptional regulator with XRE-family HTH domain